MKFISRRFLLLAAAALILTAFGDGSDVGARGEIGVFATAMAGVSEMGSG